MTVTPVGTGTTPVTLEKFKGQEKKIITISTVTVRSTTSCCLPEYRYQAGFFSNNKRFNVAVTRCRALLIIIGNPYILAKVHEREKMFEFAIENGCYSGVNFDKEMS